MFLGDLRFSQLWLSRIQSSTMWWHIIWYRLTANLRGTCCPNLQGTLLCPSTLKIRIFLQYPTSKLLVWPMSLLCMDLACNNNHFYLITLLSHLDEKVFGIYKSAPSVKTEHFICFIWKILKKICIFYFISSPNNSLEDEKLYNVQRTVLAF